MIATVLEENEMPAIVLYAAFSYYRIASWLNRMLVSFQVYY